MVAAPASTSKHAANRAATRARLIALGVERFPLKGYAATSIRDILRGSGLAIGAFYYHFGSKREFFLAVLESLGGEPGALAALATAIEPATPEEAVAIVLAPLAANPANGALSLVVADFALAHKGEPAVQREVAAIRRRSVEEIAGFLGVLQGRGVVRSDLPAEALASMTFAAVEGHVFHHAIYGAPLAEAADVAVRLIRP